MPIQYVSDLDDPQKVAEHPKAQDLISRLGLDFVKRQFRAYLPESPPASATPSPSPPAASTAANPPPSQSDRRYPRLSEEEKDDFALELIRQVQMNNLRPVSQQPPPDPPKKS